MAAKKCLSTRHAEAAPVASSNSVSGPHHALPRPDLYTSPATLPCLACVSAVESSADLVMLAL